MKPDVLEIYAEIGSLLLIATGRRLNMDGPGPAEAGTRLTQDGVPVDRGLRTGNTRVFAVDDDMIPRVAFTGPEH